MLQPASRHDVIFMEDFLEDALDFDRICEGVPVYVVFCRWQGWASAGRLDPDWPADVLVSVLLDGAVRGLFASIVGSSASCFARARLQLRVAFVR